MNGVDAVILATGNDFRAVEACAHAYASRSGDLSPPDRLSHWKTDTFTFSLELPLALGTVGWTDRSPPHGQNVPGHSASRPGAPQLMAIAASVGLLQNFAALASLITSGIQKGHMKMHLMNILNRLEATEEERQKCKAHFQSKSISFRDVHQFIANLRNY